MGRKKTGRPVGRPQWQPSQQQREQVRSLAGRGVAINHIAIIVGVDKDTLMLRCGEDVDAGRAFAVANVTGVLYKRALSEDPNAFKERQLFLVNCAGWTNSHQRHQVTTTLEELVRQSMAPADPNKQLEGPDASR